MNWKSTSSFIRKLTMDDYNKVLHDVDSILVRSSKVKYRYSSWIFMQEELNARKEQQRRTLTPQEEKEELEKWTKMHPEAFLLLLKVGNKEVSEQQFLSLYRQLIGEERYLLNSLEREIGMLKVYFQGVDTKKILKFFAEVVMLDTPEAVIKFLNCIMLENLKPLVTIAATVEDAFWRNKLSEEQVNKIKRYILATYIPEHSSGVIRQPFTLADFTPHPNAYLDMEDLKSLVVEAKFMMDALKDRT